MSEHELKCWPQFFAPLVCGDKTFEMRNNDRRFKVGDVLWLREWCPEYGYSGEELRTCVTYVLAGPAFGLGDGYVVMGLQPPRLAALKEQRCETCDNEKFMSGEGMTRWCALMRVRSCIPRYCGAWQKRREKQ